jgi:hypothetical protein
MYAPPVPPAQTATPLPQNMEVGKNHIHIVTNGTCFASVWGYGKHLIPKTYFKGNNNYHLNQIRMHRNPVQLPYHLAKQIHQSLLQAAQSQ